MTKLREERMVARTDNQPRFGSGRDHVESWFVRANDPRSARAIWLKATVLTRADGSALSQAWFSAFDGDRTQALRQDVPLAEASFEGGPAGLVTSVGPLTLGLTAQGGHSAGELGSRPRRVRWDLGFERVPGFLGDPMSLFPTRRLIDAPFPRSKLVTPFPVATFSGEVVWGDQRWDLDGWAGMQGHNWGSSHSPEYAWGQCIFAEPADGAPGAVVEGASGRIELGSRVSPLLSMLVVRRADREYRFDRIVDLWRQRPELSFPRWTLGMSGADGEATLEMVGSPSAMVCLGYQNPARATSFCLNSKTATVRLAVAPRHGTAFELHSEHGGALEFLQGLPEPAVQPVV